MVSLSVSTPNDRSLTPRRRSRNRPQEAIHRLTPVFRSSGAKISWQHARR